MTKTDMTQTQTIKWVRESSDDDADENTCEEAFLAIFGRAAVSMEVAL